MKKYFFGFALLIISFSISAQQLNGVINEFRYKQKSTNSTTYYGNWSAWKSINASLIIFSNEFVIDAGKIQHFSIVKSGEPVIDVDGNMNTTSTCKSENGVTCFVSMISQDHGKPEIIRVVQQDMILEYAYKLIETGTKTTTQPRRDYVTSDTNQDNSNSVFENNESAKIINQSNFKNNVFETSVLKSDSIDNNLVLKKLFPGNYYKNKVYGEYTVWICPSCPKCQFDSINGYMDMPGKFPYKDANFTTVSGICRYKSHDVEYCVVTFSTSYNFPPNVYTAPGILGVAVFKKENTSWSLMFFDPFAAALGTYQNAGNISKVVNISSDKVGYCMFYGDGGHGANMSYVNMQMFTFIDNKYKNILSVDNYEYTEYTEEGTTPIIEWKTEISMVDASNTFSKINLIQKGRVTQKGNIYYSHLSEDKMPELAEYLSKYKKFSFVIDETFRFNGDRYILLNSKASASSIKQSITSASKAETVESIQEVFLIPLTEVEKASFKKIVMSWNDAHNRNDMASFTELFEDEVNFYHTILPKIALIQKKKDLLKKYPNFNQQISGEILSEKLSENEVKCSFSKEVNVNSKVTYYPSYLILKKSDGDWKISVEGDLVTDKNIAKKKPLRR